MHALLHNAQILLQLTTVQISEIFLIVSSPVAAAAAEAPLAAAAAEATLAAAAVEALLAVAAAKSQQAMAQWSRVPRRRD